MRFVSKLTVLMLGAALAAGAQEHVNPHTQVNWPAACSAANTVYSFANDTCITIGGGGGGGVTPSPQFSLFYQPIPGTQAAAQGDPNITTDGNGHVVVKTLQAGGPPTGFGFHLKALSTIPADWTMDTTTPTTAIQSMVPALAPNTGSGVNGNGVPIAPFAALNVQDSAAQYATNHSAAWTAGHHFGDSITCAALGLTPLCLTTLGAPAYGADAPSGQDYVTLMDTTGTPGHPALGITPSNYGKPGGTACDINAQIAEYENPVAGDNVFRTVMAFANNITKGTRKDEQTAAQCHYSMLAWLSTYSANKCGAATFGATCMGNAPGALPAGWQSGTVAVSQVVSDGATCTVTTSANMIASGEPQILGGFTAGNAVLNGVYGIVSATGLSTTNYQMPCTVAAATYAGAGTTKTFGTTDLVTANTNASAIDFPVNTTAVNSAGNTDQSLYIVYEMADWDGALFTVKDWKAGTPAYPVKAFTDAPISGSLTGQGFPGGGTTALGVYKLQYNPDSPTALRPACNFATDANCKITVTVTSLSGTQNKVAVMLMEGPHLHTGPRIDLAGPTPEVFKNNGQMWADYNQIAENNAYMLQNQGANVFWHPMDKFTFGTTTGINPEMSDGTASVATCNPAFDLAGFPKHFCNHTGIANSFLSASVQPQYRDTPYANIQPYYNAPNHVVIIPETLQDALSQVPAQAVSVITLGCDGSVTADGSKLNGRGYSIPIVSASNTTVNLPKCGGPIEFRFPPLTLAGVVTFVPTITGADGFFKLHQYQGAICDNNNVIANGVYQWTCWPSNGAAGIETDGNPYKIQIDTVTSNAAVRIVAPNVTVGGNTTFSVFNPDSTVGYLRYVYAASAANDSWCTDFSNATMAAFCAFPDGHVTLGAPLYTNGHQFTDTAGKLLTVAGLNLNGTTAPLSLNSVFGTAGDVLTSAGAGATPTWTTPATSFAAVPLTSFCMNTVGTGNGTVYYLAPAATSGIGCINTTAVPIPAAVPGTVTACYVTSLVGGAAAGSGAVKFVKYTMTGTPGVWDSGTVTAICTLGVHAGTAACSLTGMSITLGTTNSFPDGWAISVTTGQATDTTSNVHVSCTERVALPQ